MVESEDLEMKWSDLEALGWMIKKFDDRTRRYTYQAPACNGFRQAIKSRSELKPGDKKYADILYPKVTRPAPGQMRGGEGPSRQVDGGDGGHEQEEVQEEMEQEQGGEGGGRYQETANPAADPLDIEDVATVVPGMKNHKGDLDIVAAKLKDFVVNKSDVTDFNIKKATEDLEIALKNYDHPFSRTIVDYNHNFFKDVVNFAMRHNADLLYVLVLEEERDGMLQPGGADQLFSPAGGAGPLDITATIAREGGLLGAASHADTADVELVLDARLEPDTLALFELEAGRAQARGYFVLLEPAGRVAASLEAGAVLVTPAAPGPASVALADLCLRPRGPGASLAITVSGLATLVLEVCSKVWSVP